MAQKSCICSSLFPCPHYSDFCISQYIIPIQMSFKYSGIYHLWDFIITYWFHQTFCSFPKYHSDTGYIFTGYTFFFKMKVYFYWFCSQPLYPPLSELGTLWIDGKPQSGHANQYSLFSKAVLFYLLCLANYKLVQNKRKANKIRTGQKQEWSLRRNPLVTGPFEEGTAAAEKRATGEMPTGIL